jgi:hypothetical protein
MLAPGASATPITRAGNWNGSNRAFVASEAHARRRLFAALVANRDSVESAELVS